MALSWNEIKDRALKFSNECSGTKRMEFLFELYEKYTADLFTGEKVKKKIKVAKPG
jgi:hypothetical protein